MSGLKIIVGLALAGTTIWSFLIPGADLFREPDLARILFWHLPCAFVTTIFLFAGAVQSAKTLKANSSPTADIRAEAAQEQAMLFGIITMITGILFSKAQWGAWWQWDPRQTSFLIVLLILFAYFAMRAAFSDPVKRAANSAAYSLAAMLPILFLIFVFPRLPQVQSFHPSQTVPGGFLRGEYLYVTVANFVLFQIVGTWLYKMRVRAGELELAQETQDGKLDAGGDRAATGVVRPLSVSDEN